MGGIIPETLNQSTNFNKLEEMSNLIKRKTGLPVNIWVDDIGVIRKTKHNEPRIKVQNNTSNTRQEDTFSLSISLNPEVISGECKLSSYNYNKVCNYVRTNYKPLMDYWNQKIDIEELKEILFDKEN